MVYFIDGDNGHEFMDGRPEWHFILYAAHFKWYCQFFREIGAFQFMWVYDNGSWRELLCYF